MATTPAYASTPIFGAGLLTTADTSLTAPATVVTLHTAGASGSRIDRINLQGVATTVSGNVNLFVHDGSIYNLWLQVPILAVTSSTTAPAWTVTLSTSSAPTILPLFLPNGYSLRAAVSVTQTGIKAECNGGAM